MKYDNLIHSSFHILVYGIIVLHKICSQACFCAWPAKRKRPSQKEHNQESIPINQSWVIRAHHICTPGSLLEQEHLTDIPMWIQSHTITLPLLKHLQRSHVPATTTLFRRATCYWPFHSLEILTLVGKSVLYKTLKDGLKLY